MKKPYNLDYSIERDTDRCQYIKETLDKLMYNLPNKDLELMASYILYGKNEDGQNSVQRRETLNTNTRFKTYRRKDDRLQSLDALRELPTFDETTCKPFDTKDVYYHKKPSISREKDADIPGMQQLWDSIDRVARQLALAEGKVEPQPNELVITDPYRRYLLKHELIEMRRDQYFLKDIFRPTIPPATTPKGQPQFYDWDSDSFYWIEKSKAIQQLRTFINPYLQRDISKYEHRILPDGTVQVKWHVRYHTFDWENPAHIKALMDHYSAIYMQLWDYPSSSGRCLLQDFDRYFDMCNLPPSRTFILTRHIDKASIPTIHDDLLEQFGLDYDENHLYTIVSSEIPNAIAAVARKQRLLAEAPASERQFCRSCGRFLPKDTLFFNINRARSCGFGAYCKECARAQRIQGGKQSAIDKRFKDTKVHKV